MFQSYNCCVATRHSCATCAPSHSVPLLSDSSVTILKFLTLKFPTQIQQSLLLFTSCHLLQLEPVFSSLTNSLALWLLAEYLFAPKCIVITWTLLTMNRWFLVYNYMYYSHQSALSCLEDTMSCLHSMASINIVLFVVWFTLTIRLFSHNIPQNL